MRPSSVQPGHATRRGYPCLAAVLMLVAFVVAPVRPTLAMERTSLDRATEAVVAVTAGGRRIGSGVVVAKDRVLTAAHVVDAIGGEPAALLTADRILPFEVESMDRARDLALLSCDTRDVRPVLWAPPGGLDRGEEVLVIGYPVGFKQVSLTKGIVSSTRQSHEGMDFLQVDAAINPGNSGGVLVDSAGRFVGMPVAKMSDVTVESVGFAVPEEDVRAFVEAAIGSGNLKTGPESGRGEIADGATPPVAESRSRLLVWIGVAGAVLLAISALRTMRLRPAPAGSSLQVQPAVSAVDPALRRFSVSDAAGGRTVTLRLPAVVGHGPGADLQLDDSVAGMYEVRLTEGSSGRVLATDLTGRDGMYCGDACVAEAELQQGAVLRVGKTTLTVL